MPASARAGKSAQRHAFKMLRIPFGLSKSLDYEDSLASLTNGLLHYSTRTYVEDCCLALIS